MIKSETLIVLLCLCGCALSQDSDEWSQEYEDYEGQVDQLYQGLRNEKYGENTDRLQEIREKYFDAETDEKDLGEFYDSTDEHVLSDEFYDTLVDDNGERSSDFKYALKDSVGMEYNEESEKYYPKDPSEERVNDENVNGNAPVNDYDPDDFEGFDNEFERISKSGSKEELGKRENQLEDNSDYDYDYSEHKIYKINASLNATEETNLLLIHDIRNTDVITNESKIEEEDDTKYQYEEVSSKIDNIIKIDLQEVPGDSTDAEINTSNKSKTIDSDNYTDKTDYKIKDSFENTNNENILQHDMTLKTKSGEFDDGTEDEYRDAENLYDDINEGIKKLMKIMDKIKYEEYDDESVDDNDGKSAKYVNDSSINDNDQGYSSVIRAHITGDEPRDQISEDKIDRKINNYIEHVPVSYSDDDIKTDDKYSEDGTDFEERINELNEKTLKAQINNDHVRTSVLDHDSRDRNKNSDDTAANVAIEHPIQYGDGNSDADENLSKDAENIGSGDENPSTNGISNEVSNYRRNDDGQDSLNGGEDSEDEIRQADADVYEDESKSTEDLNVIIKKFIDERNSEIIHNMKTLEISPINMKLSLDEAVTVTSPNYPEPYTDAIVIDWYFDGKGGTGIELNITDFSLDGNSGDYLLIKPGKSDTSGSNGIIFTYMLKHERKYRFMDVDDMLVRFESKGGNVQNKGFQFSVKFIEPKVSLIVEAELEPEVAARAPEQTHTLHLTGHALHEGDRVDAFVDILADMAAMYVNAKWPELITLPDEQPTLSDAVRLTRLTACNLAWPQPEGCTSVTFGIPLPDEECCDGYRLTTKQLEEMWITYSLADPFVTRMRILGIAEYDAPDDRAILTVWWVCTFGAVLLVCVTVFAVRRLSCLNEYNGMRRLHEETDSAGSGRKSDLSLYPTPHQNLPPMFADSKYDHFLDGDYDPDDTTRDLGGAFKNKSFVRDGELMDLDYDEEIIMSLSDEAKSEARPSYSSGVRPHDVYEV